MYDVDVATRARVLRKRTPTPGVDLTRYVSTRTWATAPDGTAVFFCGSGQGSGSSRPLGENSQPNEPAGRGSAWLGDFLRTGEAGEPIGITHIDHITLAQPFDAFDEAALFYRSVLDLRPSESTELAAPDVAEALLKDGALAAPGTPQSFQQLIASEIDAWGLVIARANIKAG